jgi:16S rRNA (uracil1498-N3)-methyltransferase
MQLFYEPSLKPGDNTFTLSKEEAQHAVRVLRKKTGDNISIINGKGALFQAIIKNADPNQFTVLITGYKEKEKPSPCFHICLALLKKPERIEWFIEKAIEIGVSRITIFTSRQTEKKNLKTERLAKIAVSALKQSGNLWLPEIDCSINFDTLVKSEFNGEKFIAYCRTELSKHLKYAAITGNDTIILIGPEGDFTEDEVTLALNNGFKEVSLGESRLRAETAALYALLTLQLTNI